MPELPDVERYRRLLQASGLHRVITGVSVSDSRLLDSITPRMFARHLTGAALMRTRRHGKYLLVKHDHGGWLTLHFGMSGVLAIVAPGKELPPFARVRLHFKDGGLLTYISRRMLGRVGLADDAEDFIRSHALGPDALDRKLDQDAFNERLAGLRGSVKATLMDQSVIAGIGNIYSDEILFQARLHPQARLDDLDGTARAALYRMIRRVLDMAIARGAGSEDFLDHLPRNYLLPHRQKGGRCPRCHARLKTMKLAGRTSWFCPRCQATSHLG